VLSHPDRRAGGRTRFHDPEIWRRLEQVRRRLCPHDVRQPVRRLPEPGIRLAAQHKNLELRRKPTLGYDVERKVVANLAGWNRDRRARTFCLDTFDDLFAKVFDRRRIRVDEVTPSEDAGA